MDSKRGAAYNANGAAILIIIVTALIVLYILFLPPSDRAELLGESSGSSGGSSGSNGATKIAPSKTLLLENVGRVDYLDSDEREHFIPSFRLSTKVEGMILQEVDSLYVKSSVFDSQIHNITFRVDRELSSDLQLSFNVGKQANGRLIMLVNGQQVLSEEVAAQSSKVLSIPIDMVDRYNTLTIGVASPGWAFWEVNEYAIENLQLTANVKDLSGSSSVQVFTLSDDEVEHLKAATLKYYADCTPTAAGRLEVKLNGKRIFSGFGDCGVISTVELDKYSLDGGENELTFTTQEGSYLFTNVVVEVDLEEPVYPIFYFDLEDDYFTSSSEGDAVCGESDGTCPDDCNADIDKDCCFEESSGNYWCDVETEQLNDRCVSFVTAATCGRCDSGYEDKRGYAADACEGLCGDDKDDECPAGCSKYLDKDCCFAAGENYWCDDVPVQRPISAVCKGGVEPDERKGCPGKYYNEDGSRLSYTTTSDDDDDELASRYRVMLRLDFPNEELKSGSVLVNGREFGLQTRALYVEKDISDYVRVDTNSIQIVPARSIDVTQLKVRIERKS